MSDATYTTTGPSMSGVTIDGLLALTRKLMADRPRPEVYVSEDGRLVAVIIGHEFDAAGRFRVVMYVPGERDREQVELQCTRAGYSVRFAGLLEAMERAEGARAYLLKNAAVRWGLPPTMVEGPAGDNYAAAWQRDRQATGRVDDAPIDVPRTE